MPAYWVSRGSTTWGSKLLSEDIAVVKQPYPGPGARTEERADECRFLERKRQTDKTYKPFDYPLDDLITPADVKGLSMALKEKKKAPRALPVPILKGNDYLPTHSAECLTHLDHGGYCHRSALASAVPGSSTSTMVKTMPRVDMPPSLLSSAPSVPLSHLLHSLQAGGANSECVERLPTPVYRPERVDHEGVTNSQIKILEEKHICVSSSGDKQLERLTRDQAGSELWKQSRHVCLTTSNFGTVFKRRPGMPSKTVMRTPYLIDLHVTTM